MLQSKGSYPIRHLKVTYLKMLLTSFFDNFGMSGVTVVHLMTEAFNSPWASNFNSCTVLRTLTFFSTCRLTALANFVLSQCHLIWLFFLSKKVTKVIIPLQSDCILSSRSKKPPFMSLMLQFTESSKNLGSTQHKVHLTLFEILSTSASVSSFSSVSLNEKRQGKLLVCCKV